jgi:hypothetical protein
MSSAPKPTAVVWLIRVLRSEVEHARPTDRCDIDNIENPLFSSRVSNGRQSYRKHQLVGKTYRADTSPIRRYLIRRCCVS